MKKFRTEVSWSILGPIFAIYSLTSFFIYISEGYNDITILSLSAGIVVLTLYLIFGISYEIVNDEILKVRAGIYYKIDVPIANIHTIEKTNSILSAPASSLKRIEIKYNKYDSVVISPQHREVFLSELKRINPNIEIRV